MLREALSRAISSSIPLEISSLLMSLRISKFIVTRRLSRYQGLRSSELLVRTLRIPVVLRHLQHFVAAWMRYLVRLDSEQLIQSGSSSFAEVFHVRVEIPPCGDGQKVRKSHRPGIILSRYCHTPYAGIKICYFMPRQRSSEYLQIAGIIVHVSSRGLLRNIRKQPPSR